MVLPLGIRGNPDAAAPFPQWVCPGRKPMMGEIAKPLKPRRCPLLLRRMGSRNAAGVGRRETDRGVSGPLSLPPPREVPDQFVNGGRQVFLGVERCAVLPELEVQVWTGRPPRVADTADGLSLPDRIALVRDDD